MTRCTEVLDIRGLACPLVVGALCWHPWTRDPVPVQQDRCTLGLRRSLTGSWPVPI